MFDRLRPRPLLPIAERPIISYSLRWLAASGVGGITVCLNGASREVRTAVEAEADLGCPLEFREDRAPRGTAGTARDAVSGVDAHTFLVVDGTAIPRIEPRRMLDEHGRSGAAITVLARGAAHTGAGGSGLSPAGVYAFDWRAFAHVPVEGFQDIKETLLTRLYDAGEVVATCAADAPGDRIVSIESYLAANANLIPGSLEGQPPPGFERFGQAHVHVSARVSDRARLVGPVIIGSDTVVDEDATIVGPSAIGAGCHLGAAAVVSRSVLWDRCVVGPGALLDRCLIADAGWVPAGSQLYRALRTGPLRGQAVPSLTKAPARRPDFVPAEAHSRRQAAGGRPATHVR